jgi:RNA polymerase sigma-70 factor (ECF subfamily)
MATGGRGVTEGSATEEWSHLLVFHDELLRIATRRVGNVSEARDIVVDALASAVRYEGDIENPAAWMTRVVCNLCAQRHRDRRYQPLAVRYAVRESIPVPSPEDEVCDRVTAEWYAARVRDLPDRQRAAIELFADGCDVGAVARVLGTEYKAAESLLSRARRAVRDGVLPSAVPLLLVLRRRTGRVVAALALSAAATPGAVTTGAAPVPAARPAAGVVVPRAVVAMPAAGRDIRRDVPARASRSATRRPAPPPAGRRATPSPSAAAVDVSVARVLDVVGRSTRVVLPDL